MRSSRPGIRLEALTTTFGNTDVDTATRNTLRILELAGRDDVPVARGPGRSLLKPFAGGADHVHGVGGLGEVALPEPRAKAVAEPAPDLMTRLARENPGEMTIAAVGPVTNVALALAKTPELAGLVKRIVVMGSTIFHPGIQGIASRHGGRQFLERSRGGADRLALGRADHARRHGRHDESSADGRDAQDDCGGGRPARRAA